MTSALLSCSSLRKLHVSSEWLSGSTQPPAPHPPALPLLEALELDIVEGIDEATMVVLLDAAPGLEKLLLLNTCPLPYDALVWIGQRCPNLRAITAEEGKDGIKETAQHIPTLCRITPHRWAPPSLPAVPLLATLIFDTL